jgi:hypothetical protein
VRSGTSWPGSHMTLRPGSRTIPFPLGPARRILRKNKQQAGAVDPPARAKAMNPSAV